MMPLPAVVVVVLLEPDAAAGIDKARAVWGVDVLVLLEEPSMFGVMLPAI